MKKASKKLLRNGLAIVAGLTIIPMASCKFADGSSSVSNSVVSDVSSTSPDSDSSPIDSTSTSPSTSISIEVPKSDYDMSGASFADATVPYDGLEHELVITGALPEGVTVSYTSNKLTEVGTLTVTASFTGDDNHNPISDMVATLTVYDGDQLAFCLKEDGTYAVTGVKDTQATEIEIPSDYYGTAVTSIAESAFSGCSNLTSVIIPEGITLIEDSAFEGCLGLTSITVPNSVTRIGLSAFEGCTGLTSMALPFVGEKADGTGETYFGYIFGADSYENNSGFVPTSLRKVNVASGSEISGHAFSYCTGITSITISNSVTGIGDYAFYQCISLTDITIPDKVTSLGEYIFYHCNSLTNIIIPSSVSSIGFNAFNRCGGLTSITIPSSVTSIGNSAFSGCTGLIEVNISDIEAWAQIEFESATSNPLYYSHGLYLNGTQITSIELSSGIDSIGNYAFYNCTNLTSITIPSSVTCIGYMAFNGCTSLTSITIPSSVTSIGDSAFCNCSGLTSITIPSSVTGIGYMAFNGCTSLTTIYYSGTVSQWNAYGSQLGINSGVVVICSDGSKTI
ncbi:MAG: leucine-rich repeat domain-containing protein [Bacilli bacterium]